jgi:hypothetical protein
MKGLTIIKPLPISQAMLVSSTVPEADYAVYAGGTTYALAARVIYQSVIYQSLQASNTGRQPDTSPTWWVKVSATNRWKLFDLVNSSQTAQATSMSYTVRPGQAITSVAAINMVGVTGIRVRVISDAFGTVYDETITRTRLPTAAGWWSWFFGKRTESLASYYLDLPSYADAQIVVDFTGQTDMAVGTLILGTVSVWGNAVLSGVQLGIKDYSRKETNEWGDVVLTQRSFAKKAQVPLSLDPAQIDSLYDYLSGLRATPALWIVSDQYTSSVVYGYYQDFEILITYRDIADCSLTLEGLA